ncbi:MULTISPECIES: hypothetical protein [Enterobacteriaceae]|uniref:hypothetical protein n=1 Tax=Leclercia TaxID=83654 RepID=UPI0013314036|nr:MULTISPECIES: hypothetical protein [Leclercia]MBM6636857.1 hypothetical protein [Leclercia adecarboxylata]MEB6381604.1 hypothetical protein [Leclercia adecarboxylata]URM25366.1 hypothetical protein JJN11_23440 [Leclercia adecarboxylata]
MWPRQNGVDAAVVACERNLATVVSLPFYQLSASVPVTGDWSWDDVTVSLGWMPGGR